MTVILEGEANGSPTTRDIGEAPPITDRPARPPRKQIVAIGIDQYRSWNRLHNAVNDARGAVEAFKAHGFEEFRPALIDDAATHEALDNLVSNDLRSLGDEDSLVLFFAGHGHTVSNRLAKGPIIKDGYLIPFDADPQGGKTTTWINVKNWLAEVSKLPAKHILVILDACHSGIALDAVMHWRGAAPLVNEPFSVLRTRFSRRILTSALDNELALDSGPRQGHSLFTGCLIEGLTGGLPSEPGLRAFTGSELGLYVQRRVGSYPSPHKQTPDFGSLSLDDRGELVIDLPRSPLPPVQRTGAKWLSPKGRSGNTEDITESTPPRIGATGLGPKHPPQPGLPVLATPIVKGADGLRPRRTTTPPPDTGTTIMDEPPPAVAVAEAGPVALPQEPTPLPSPPAPQPPSHQSEPPAPTLPAPSFTKVLDETFIAKLDLHDKTRARERVLSVIAADTLTALTGWASWSARHGWLTVVSEEAELESVIGDVLDQVPWMRLLPSASARFAAAVGMDEPTVDASLDKRTGPERESWIEDIAGRDQLAKITGWLLLNYREPWATGPDLVTAPARNFDLLAALAALQAPISILLHHQAPSAAWLQQAIQTAVQLIAYLPQHAVAIGVPRSVLAQVMHDRQGSAALALARKGVVPLDLAGAPVKSADKPSAAQALYRALTAYPPTAQLFTLNALVKTPDNERPVSVDLYAKDAQLAIQIDDWYHTPDRQSYQRDRKPDRWLQRAGIFVTRFLAEDVESRLERVVNEIALGVATRSAANSTEKSS